MGLGTWLRWRVLWLSVKMNELRLGDRGLGWPWLGVLRLCGLWIADSLLWGGMALADTGRAHGGIFGCSKDAMLLQVRCGAELL